PAEGCTLDLKRYPVREVDLFLRLALDHALEHRDAAEEAADIVEDDAGLTAVGGEHEHDRTLAWGQQLRIGAKAARERPRSGTQSGSCPHGARPRARPPAPPATGPRNARSSV